ncbi:DH domain-containing protein [Aphelenchoides fujianensis]|nr:DH domain-containing protein [Aphelenchoides fujianensis]
MKRHLPPFFASFRSSKRRQPPNGQQPANNAALSHSSGPHGQNVQVTSVQSQWPPPSPVLSPPASAGLVDRVDENFGASTNCVFCAHGSHSTADFRRAAAEDSVSLRSSPAAIRRSVSTASASSGWSAVTKIHLNGDEPRFNDQRPRITLHSSSSAPLQRDLNGNTQNRHSSASLVPRRRVLVLDDDGRLEQAADEESDDASMGEAENIGGRAHRQIQVLHDFQPAADFPPSTSEQPPPQHPEVASPTRALAAMELVTQPTVHQHHKNSLDYHHYSSIPGTSKTTFVMNELLSTERAYVAELESIVEHYVKPFEAPENAAHLPPGLRDQSALIFGNIRDLYELHSRYVLPEFVRSVGSPVTICHFFINYRTRFLALYRAYCQNKPVSETLRRDHNADGCRFFAECQRRAQHQLPLSAYLLTPVQRITKYQLLLKELLRFSKEDADADEIRHDVQAALAAMLDVLAQINSEMQQLHILGYAGDLRQLGPLRLQTECEIFTFKRKTRRLSNKSQKRHLFLFDGGVLFCKRRTQPLPYSSEFSEFYEHKFCIPVAALGFAECSKQAPDRFELWDEHKSDGYAVYTTDEGARAKWIQRLAMLTVLNAHHQQQHQGGVKPERYAHHRQAALHSQQSPTKVHPSGADQKAAQSPTSRPQSWTSDSTTVSSRSSTSAFDDSASTTHVDSLYTPDPNGNHPADGATNGGGGSACTSISSGSRRSSSSHTSGASDNEQNNTTAAVSPSTPSIHTSKSLQNAALSSARELARETAVSEV